MTGEYKGSEDPVSFYDDQLTVDQTLRCAWLREHAVQMAALDPTGQLSAALRDFADLLEAADAKGWFL